MFAQTNCRNISQQHLNKANVTSGFQGIKPPPTCSLLVFNTMHELRIAEQQLKFIALLKLSKPLIKLCTVQAVPLYFFAIGVI